MVGFDHHGAPGQTDSPPESNRATRYGHILFAFYLVLYGAYVLINAFSPSVMAKTPWGGINLAVLSGLGLIGVAFLLALLYDWLCRLLLVPAAPRGTDDGRETGR